MLPEGRGLALVALVALWYIVSSGYSIYAKIALSAGASVTALELTVLQFVVGILGCWVDARFSVNAFVRELRAGGPALALVGLSYTVGAYTTTASMALGSVAIAYVVKSAEPLFAVALSTVLLGQRYSARTLVTLVPLTVGMLMASYKDEPSSGKPVSDGGGLITWLAASVSAGAVAAIVSNVGMSGRNVLVKLRQTLDAHERALTPPLDATASAAHAGAVAPIALDEHPRTDEERVTPAPRTPAAAASAASSSSTGGEKTSTKASNASSDSSIMFGCLSVWALAYSLPLLVAQPESAARLASWPVRLLAGEPAAVWTTLSAACHAGYTLCSMMVLSMVEPASHALITALKHLFVIVTGALMLGSPMTILQMIGTVLAVGGVVAYNRARSADHGAGSIIVPDVVRSTVADSTKVAALAALVLLALATALPVLPETRE